MKNSHPKTSFISKFSRGKYAIVFVVGMTSVMLANAYVGYVTIENNVDNAVQYIRNLVLTSDGSQNGTTGIVLNGLNGNAGFMGNVGIGTSTPTGNLHIKSDD